MWLFAWIYWRSFHKLFSNTSNKYVLYFFEKKSVEFYFLSFYIFNKNSTFFFESYSTVFPTIYTHYILVAPPPRRVVCEPSPCGPNSQCRIVGDQPACSCLPNYIGRPPNCRPECINDLECPNHLACKNDKCRDPCPGSCGNNAQCTIVNHKPVCSCLPGYIGDPISSCRIAPPPCKI